ncbi:hypothetical protein D1Z90_09350 [Motilimonas pumila]|uniref:Capsular biosynthesis protein n=2 Tax=Motilimonas pumila TaxID=2303987 RepID=A0A418YFJ5_9GAMM|nr:hypothetical protein D1Z90_09350 [Motilimonas pumila]
MCYRQLALVVFSCCWSVSAWSEVSLTPFVSENGIRIPASGTNTYPIQTANGIEVLPSFDVVSFYDDNVTNTNAQTTTSWGSILSPAIAVAIQPSRHKYELRYRLSRGDYFSSKQDNYTDHFFNLFSGFEFNTRNRLFVYYDFTAGHDERGDGISEGVGDLIDEVVRYHIHDASLKYRFGGNHATGRLEFSLGYEDKAYRNFRETTQFRDFDAINYQAAFYYRLAPKSSLLFEVMKNDKRYDKVSLNNISRDSDDHFVFVGASWDTTASITGTAKVGYQHKRFKAGERKNFEDISWDVGLTWYVKPFSSIELNSQRSAKDPEQSGDYKQVTLIDLTWQHYWLPQLNSSLSWSFINDDFKGITREDDTHQYSLGLNYDFHRWLSLGAGVHIKNKNSNQNSIGYDKNLFFITAKVVM